VVNARERTILSHMTSTAKNKWTPETIQATLEPIVAELGRFPKREELSERGLGGLSSAMGRHGGVAEWRAKFAELPAVVAATPETPEVTHEAIAQRAYFIALDGESDPVVAWLTAERELVAA
jgi:hypothetical protein